MSTILISVDVNEVLSEISVEDVIRYFGVDNLLGEMEPSDVVRHMGDDLIEYFDDNVVEDHYLNINSISDQLGNYSTEQLTDELINRGVDISQ